MFFSDVEEKHAIKIHVNAYLKSMGLKGIKRGMLTDDTSEQNTDNSEHMRSFGMPLSRVYRTEKTLPNGHKVLVPRVVDIICNYLLEHAKKEGLFRRTGSKVRQKNLKRLLDGYEDIDWEEYDVLDVAAVLKTYLQDLPKSLIPKDYHDLFIACINHSNHETTLFLAVILLPRDHMDLLAYVMHFFKLISDNSRYNKMDPFNLAVCIGPTIMPVSEVKKIDAVVEIIRTLINSCQSIGFVSNDVIAGVGIDDDDEQQNSNCCCF